MDNRNYLIMRSVAFGFFAKLTGALVVFLGIPLIAHYLSSTQYASFLRAMSLGSLLMIPFGAVGLSCIRTLSSAVAGGNRVELQKAVSEASGAYVLVAAILLCVLFATVVPFQFLGINKAGIIASIFSISQGFFQLGDTLRVASRKDFISSCFQVVGSVILIIMLLMIHPASAVESSFIYFGVPASIQLLILLHYRFSERISLLPSMARNILRDQAVSTTPFIINSILDYIKIFGSGLILSTFSSTREYALYQTLVLMIARLVNPLSLLTRPLMPAYIDAIRNNDSRWLSKVGNLIAIVFAIACLAVSASLLTPQYVLERITLPGMKIPSNTTLFFAGLFLVAHTFNTLLMPIFASRSEMKRFLIGGAIFTFLGIITGLILVYTMQRSMIAGMGCCLSLNTIYIIYNVRFGKAKEKSLDRGI